MEVGIDGAQLRMRRQMTEQLLAQADQRAGAVGRHVHPPEQLEPGRLGGTTQGQERVQPGLGAVGLGGGKQAIVVDGEAAGQELEEGQPFGCRHGAQGLHDLARQCCAGGLAPGREQVAAQGLDPPPAAAEPVAQQLAAGIGDRGQELVDHAHAHRGDSTLAQHRR